MLSILYPFVRQFKNAEIFRSRVCQQRIITRTGAASIPLRRFPVDPDVRFRIAKIWICAAAASADDVPNFHPNTVNFAFRGIQDGNCQVWILIRNDIFCKPCFDPQIAKAAVAAFANELRIMDHAPISIDLSQFFQKEICHVRSSSSSAQAIRSFSVLSVCSHAACGCIKWQLLQTSAKNGLSRSSA